MKGLFFVLIVILFFRFFLNFWKNQIIFQPTKIKEDFHPKDLYNDEKMKEQIIRTNNGERIHILQMFNESKPFHILYSHGNAGHIYNRFPIMKTFHKNFSITMFDYEGYGRSTGKPSEGNFYRDIESVYKHMVIHQKINPNQIILYGESIGCPVAAWLAQKFDRTKFAPKGLVLQSGFSSIQNMARDFLKAPRPLINLFITDDFNTMNYVREIKSVPILVLHSRNDEIIDYTHANKIASCNPNVDFCEIYGSHNNVSYDETFFGAINKLAYKRN
jgi:pimeloyl-ACP methyl ester carboxylesterase